MFWMFRVAQITLAKSTEISFPPSILGENAFLKMSWHQIQRASRRQPSSLRSFPMSRAFSFFPHLFSTPQRIVKKLVLFISCRSPLKIPTWRKKSRCPESWPQNLLPWRFSFGSVVVLLYLLRWGNAKGDTEIRHFRRMPLVGESSHRKIRSGTGPRLFCFINQISASFLFVTVYRCHSRYYWNSSFFPHCHLVGIRFWHYRLGLRCCSC